MKRRDFPLHDRQGLWGGEVPPADAVVGGDGEGCRNRTVRRSELSVVAIARARSAEYVCAEIDFFPRPGAARQGREK